MEEKIYGIFIIGNYNIEKFNLLELLTNKEVENRDNEAISEGTGIFKLESRTEQIIFLVRQIIFKKPYKTLEKTRLQFYYIKPYLYAWANIIFFVADIFDSIVL